MNRSLLWPLALGSLPIGFFGLTLEHYAETVWRTPYVIGTMLILVGILMAVADRTGRMSRRIGEISWLDSILIGFAQALAIVPGTSRSGITITAGLFRGLDRHSAARFSFLLSTPAIFAASAKAAYDLSKSGGVSADMRLPFVVGMLISAVTGCAVIAFFMRYLRHHSLRFFVIYRVVFGIIVIALAAFVRRQAG
jgi:undecaprenyl-diphosphatase